MRLGMLAAAVALSTIGLTSANPGHYTGPGRRSAIDDQDRNRGAGGGVYRAKVREAAKERANEEYYAGLPLNPTSRQVIEHRVRDQAKGAGALPRKWGGYQAPPEPVFILEGVERARRLKGWERRLWLAARARRERFEPAMASR